MLPSELCFCLSKSRIKYTNIVIGYFCTLNVVFIKQKRNMKALKAL